MEKTSQPFEKKGHDVKIAMINAEHHPEIAEKHQVIFFKNFR